MRRVRLRVEGDLYTKLLRFASRRVKDAGSASTALAAHVLHLFIFLVVRHHKKATWAPTDHDGRACEILQIAKPGAFHRIEECCYTCVDFCIARSVLAIMNRRC